MQTWSDARCRSLGSGFCWLVTSSPPPVFSNAVHPIHDGGPRLPQRTGTSCPGISLSYTLSCPADLEPNIQVYLLTDNVTQCELKPKVSSNANLIYHI
jgi:hypothetical protein